jgi:hypothetical protein
MFLIRKQSGILSLKLAKINEIIILLDCFCGRTDTVLQMLHILPT